MIFFAVICSNGLEKLDSRFLSHATVKDIPCQARFRMHFHSIHPSSHSCHSYRFHSLQTHREIIAMIKMYQTKQCRYKPPVFTTKSFHSFFAGILTVHRSYYYITLNSCEPYNLQLVASIWYHHSIWQITAILCYSR